VPQRAIGLNEACLAGTSKLGRASCHARKLDLSPSVKILLHHASAKRICTKLAHVRILCCYGSDYVVSSNKTVSMMDTRRDSIVVPLYFGRSRVFFFDPSYSGTPS